MVDERGVPGLCLEGWDGHVGVWQLFDCQFVIKMLVPAVHRLPYIVRSLSSAAHRLPPIVRRPSSAGRYPPPTARRPLPDMVMLVGEG